MLKLFFSLNGRIARSTYWALIAISIIPGFLKLIMLGSGLNMSFAPSANKPLATTLLVIAFMCWVLQAMIQIPAFVKRLHDMNRSGWWCLFCLLPGIAFIAWLLIGALPGVQGPNRYGDDITERPRFFKQRTVENVR